MSAPHTGSRRSIRSFVVRAGRITGAQERALAELWPRYGLELAELPADLDAIFGRRARRILEIGFGDGEHLAALAAARRDEDFLGVEVHRPGVGHLLLAAERAELDNLRLVCADALDVLAAIAPGSLDEVLVLFPDPWPKKRHHKRRIVTASFVELVAGRLRPGGQLYLATDWQPYAMEMLTTLEACPSLENLDPYGGFLAAALSRAPTRFERRGLRLGHEVRDLAFRRR